MSLLVSIQTAALQNCALTQSEVDAVLSDIYSARASYTYATPALNIAGTNSAPSGTYAEENPPTTGNGIAYELVVNPAAEAFNEWTITRTT